MILCSSRNSFRQFKIILEYCTFWQCCFLPVLFQKLSYCMFPPRNGETVACSWCVRILFLELDSTYQRFHILWIAWRRSLGLIRAVTVLDFSLPRWSSNKYRGLAVNCTTPPPSKKIDVVARASAWSAASKPLRAFSTSTSWVEPTFTCTQQTEQWRIWFSN